MKHDSADHYTYTTTTLHHVPLVLYLVEVDAGLWHVVDWHLSCDAGEVAAGDLAAEIATLGEEAFFRRLAEQYHEAERARDYY